MPQKNQSYQNVMELLVDQEINYQIDHQKIPLEISAYVNTLEVATYALNRLPALYASSLEGIEKQKRKARKEFKHKIEQAVSLGFAAVQRDPLRTSTPIEKKEQEVNTIENVKKALVQLSNEVPQQELSWIVDFMAVFLQRIKEKKITEKEVVKLYYLLYYYCQEKSL